MLFLKLPYKIPFPGQSAVKASFTVSNYLCDCDKHFINGGIFKHLQKLCTPILPYNLTKKYLIIYLIIVFWKALKMIYKNVQ